MSILHSFRMFSDKCLSSTALEIVGAFQKFFVEYQEDNDRLRKLLGIPREIKYRRIESLQLSLAVSEEEVPPALQRLDQEWSGCLGQKDPEPIQIKEEQYELRTSQEEEQFQGLVNTEDSLSTPFHVKMECGQEDPLRNAILEEYPTFGQLEMSKLESFSLFLNEFLAASAVKILKAVKKTVAEYREENDHLRRMLQLTPELVLLQEDSDDHSSGFYTFPRFGSDSLKFSLAVSEAEFPPEQQHHEPKWRLSLGQKDPESIQIKEEQEELRTSQEEEQFQGLLDTKDCILTPCMKSEYDQEVQHWSLTLPQTQTVKRRECYSKTIAIKPFGLVTHPTSLDPPDNQHNSSSHSSAINGDQVRLDSRPPSPPSDPSPSSDPGPPIEKHCSNPSTTSRKAHSCSDCGEMFALKSDLEMHVILAMKRPSSCCFCKKLYTSTCKLKAHIQLCHSGKPNTCPICGKVFKLKQYQSRHMRIHAEEKPFGCGDCGKSFHSKGALTEHARIHTGEKPFSCGDCGKCFNHKGVLTYHKRIHTGEKPFHCGDCGKSFHQNGDLTKHKRIHTGEKPFSCGDCGKSFRQKGALTYHKRIHTGEKSFSCGDCGKSFLQNGDLTKHKRIHTGEKPFSCGYCGKSFCWKKQLNLHVLTHTRN